MHGGVVRPGGESWLPRALVDTTVRDPNGTHQTKEVLLLVLPKLAMPLQGGIKKTQVGTYSKLSGG